MKLLKFIYSFLEFYKIKLFSSVVQFIEDIK